MSQDWPSPPQHPDRLPLPRAEDLPVVPEGYDPARVEEAFDAFYRHLAQLDSTLKTLESVEVFSRQASELRADLRSIRAAGWSPYPRGYPVAPTPSLGFDIPAVVPRIALEVVFLIVAAVIVAVANFKALEIVVVMLVAFAITALVEWFASRERRPTESTFAHVGEPVVLETGTNAEEPPVPTPERAEGAGWAAFAEPSGPEALTVMGALSEDDDEPAQVAEAAVADAPLLAVAESNLESEADPKQVAETTEEFSGLSEPELEDQVHEGSRRRWGWRRKAGEEAGRAPEPEEQRAPKAPKHVRVLPPPEPVLERDLDPWERGFDFALDDQKRDLEAAAAEDDAPLRPPQR